MKSKFLLIPLITLLVAGCSATTPEPEYEEGAFIQFEKCMDAFIQDNKGFYSTAEILTYRATEACEVFIPKKK